MRNLKKILALALALVMTLSLMTVANATSFNDDADISDAYSEAVTVLSNLKVFKGVNDGSNFAPKQTISRGEVAAIIYRIVTGDVNDANIAQHAAYAETAFADVKATDWDAGYIGYCANAQIIVGDGTNFYPRQSVTGYQALAMILRAIGYDANDEFQGEGWEIRTASTAQQLGLLRNIGASSLNGAATREMVAEILFRTIAEAYVVKYTSAFGYQPVYLPTSGGNTTSDLPLFGSFTAATLGYQTFKLEKTSGEISAVGRTAGTTTLVDRSTAANGTALNPVTVTGTSTPWTDIGYGAYVYTVPTTGAKTRAAVSDVVITGKSLKATTDGTEIQNANVAVEDGAHLYYNGEYIGNILISSTGAITNPSTGKIYDYLLDKDGIVGVKVDYIDNDNGGRAEVVVVTEYTVASVTGITNTTNTGSNAVVSNSTYLIEHSTTNTGREAVSVPDAKLVANQALAVGDLVTYVEYPGSYKGENPTVSGDYYVTVAGMTTGRYTQINYNSITRSYESSVIGGTTYVPSEVNATCNAEALAYLTATANVGKDVDVYTDPYGYILHVNDHVSAKDYLFVLRNDHSSSVAAQTYAQVAYADGTIQNVYLTADNLNVLNSINEHIYSYTTRGSNLAIAPAGCETYNGTLSATTQLATGLYMNNSTVVVDVRGAKAGDTQAKAVYTGWSNMPSVVDAELHYIDVNGVITLAFLVDGKDAIAPTDFIVYTTGYHNYTINADGSRTYNLPVIQDGEPKTIALNEEQYEFVCALGVGIYYFGPQGQIMADSFTAFTEPEVKSEIRWNDGLLVRTIGGTTSGLAYNENTVMYTLDIAHGNYYQYTMASGMDAITNYWQHVVGTGSVKMAYVVTAGGVATEIYVVEGDVADIETVNEVYYPVGTRYTKVVTLANGDKETRYYYQKDGEITNYTNVAIANVDVIVNGVPTWENIVPGTKIDLPKTANNPAVAAEWLRIENTDTKAVSYVLAGTKGYEVTGNLKITTGYYQYFVDGEDYYTTAGHKTFAQLVTDLGLTVKGTGSLWTFAAYKDAYVSNATSGLDVSAYESVSLKTGYVLVDATAVATTAKVTVNGNEVTDLTAAFPVSVDDHVIVTNTAGQVKGEWGPTTAQPIVGDITISTVA